jgi:hypothetical protein
MIGLVETPSGTAHWYMQDRTAYVSAIRNPDGTPVPLEHPIRVIVACNQMPYELAVKLLDQIYQFLDTLHTTNSDGVAEAVDT